MMFGVQSLRGSRVQCTSCVQDGEGAIKRKSEKRRGVRLSAFCVRGSEIYRFAVQGFNALRAFKGSMASPFKGPMHFVRSKVQWLRRSRVQCTSCACPTDFDKSLKSNTLCRSGGFNGFAVQKFNALRAFKMARER